MTQERNKTELQPTNPLRYPESKKIKIVRFGKLLVFFFLFLFFFLFCLFFIFLTQTDQWMGDHSALN